MRDRKALGGLVSIAVAAIASLGGAAAETGSGTDAAEAVAATLEVERTLLAEDLVRHERLATARGRSLELLGELYDKLDAAVRQEAGTEAVESLLERIEQAERQRSDGLIRERVLIDRLRERQRRIALLQDSLADLEARVEEATGPLEGRWDVTLLPIKQQGSFTLHQSGTVVSGTYRLDGGWTGSIQGTLVNRKTHLVRIDSKLGRSMEFEGFLSGDGSRIRGTWLSYDLSGEGPPSGQWSAVRADSEP